MCSGASQHLVLIMEDPAKKFKKWSVKKKKTKSERIYCHVNIYKKEKNLSVERHQALSEAKQC